MAYGNWHKYLRDRAEVSLKKYLYVFRPLLAARWIERELGQVPMRLQQLLDEVLEESEVRAALDELVARKMAGSRTCHGAAVEVLSDFVTVELARLDALVSPAESDPMWRC
jgi:predicted nucleotidyltransferase